MRRIATLALVFTLLLPATALAAGNSTCQAYNPQTCSAVNVSNTQTPAATSATSATLVSSTTSKTLPFTGLDAFLLVGGGATLLGAGFGVRVLSRKLN
jgi:hypothetical protein